jgi:hypothetical protein
MYLSSTAHRMGGVGAPLCLEKTLNIIFALKPHPLARPRYFQGMFDGKTRVGPKYTATRFDTEQLAQHVCDQLQTLRPDLVWGAIDADIRFKRKAHVSEAAVSASLSRVVVQVQTEMGVE